MRANVHPTESQLLDYMGGATSHGLTSHIDECSECRLVIAAIGPSAPSTIRTSMNSRRGTAALRSPSGSDSRMTSLPSTGDLLGGRFRLERILGRGATGTVFAAFDEAIETPVAIKLFSAGLTADTRALDMIQNEVMLGRKLAHPNVRRVYDLEDEDGLTFLTMELIEGQTLEAVLRSGELAEGDAMNVLEQVVAGVAAAHDAGIIHRDLKPANVAIEPSGRVVVMDFGLGRDMEQAVSTAHDCVLLGTPAYWSPEQSRGERASFASDVYSLGVLAFRLLCQQPYSVDAAVTAPRRYRKIIARCLAHQPRRRYSSAAEVAIALREARRPKRALWALAPLPAVAACLVWVHATGKASPPVATIVAAAPLDRSERTAEEAPRVGSPPASPIVATMDVSQLPNAVEVAARTPARRENRAAVRAPEPRQAPTRSPMTERDSTPTIDRQSPYQ